MSNAPLKRDAPLIIGTIIKVGLKLYSYKQRICCNNYINLKSLVVEAIDFTLTQFYLYQYTLSLYAEEYMES